MSVGYNHTVRRGTRDDYLNYNVDDNGIKLSFLRAGPGDTIDCRDCSLDRDDVHQGTGCLNELKYRATYRFIPKRRNSTADYRLLGDIPV